MLYILPLLIFNLLWTTRNKARTPATPPHKKQEKDQTIVHPNRKAILNKPNKLIKITYHRISTSISVEVVPAHQDKIFSSMGTKCIELPELNKT